MSKPRYSEFSDLIDVDAFEALIGWEYEYQRGDEDIGYCPDYWGLHKHGDSTGKFAINREDKLYNCWVCGGGSLLSLLMEAEGIDVDTATEILLKLTTGDHRSDDEFLDYYVAMFMDTEKRVKSLPYFNERVLDNFTKASSRWFYNRGISPDVYKEFKLFVARGATKPAPIKNGEKIDDDYVGDCAVFPHYWQGRLVGWQHRWLAPDDERPKWVAKYTNTTDFPKTETLYAYDKALRSKEPVIVVESVPSCLFLWSLGYPAVATFGSSVPDEQLRLLRRFQQGVILAPDNDPAPKGTEKLPPGIKWRDALTRYLDRYIPVSHVPVISTGPVPKGEDIGDLAGEHNPREMVAAYLEQAEEPSSFFS